jgi:hypothetical protein
LLLLTLAWPQNIGAAHAAVDAAGLGELLPGVLQLLLVSHLHLLCPGSFQGVVRLKEFLYHQMYLIPGVIRG